MTENAENEKTFILKISRKLRDCYLPRLATRKVTCMILFFFSSCSGGACVFVCVWPGYMGKKGRSD